MTDIIQPDFNEDDKQAMIDELENKIKLMKEDKENKCKAAKEQLVSMLEITAEKYLTATGTAEALRALRFAGEDMLKWGKNFPTKILTLANRLAKEMSGEVKAMKNKAEKLPYAKMNQLCDSFYDKKFNFGKQETATYDDVMMVYDLAFELMRLDLCRNVGDGAEDLVSFIERVEEEIDATGAELKKLKEEK